MQPSHNLEKPCGDQSSSLENGRENGVEGGVKQINVFYYLHLGLLVEEACLEVSLMNAL